LAGGKPSDKDRGYTLDALELSTSSGKKYFLRASMTTEPVNAGGRKKRVRTCEYIYAILDQDRKALYEFHWHPTDRAGNPAKYPYPHAHIRGTDTRFDALDRKHIPSGRIAFEEVIRFLIEELGVGPEETNWKAILEETKKKFDAEKSW